MVNKFSKRRFKKYLNVKLATNPGKVVLNAIIIVNVLLFVASVFILKSLNIPGSEDMGYLKATFYSFRLILSQSLDYDIVGPNAVAIGMFTVAVMFLGVIFFTGSLIAYLTNYIATYMGYKSPAMKKLYLYNHIVLLGWNVRATEIIRNLLFTGKHHDVIILANEDREKIEDEIDEAIADALYARNSKLKQKYASLPFIQRILTYERDRLRNKLTVMIKTGETYSSQQLKSISLNLADAVIILGENLNNNVAETNDGRLYAEQYGNSQIIKTVAQVVNITASEDSINNQNVIVEVDDQVTLDLVAKIIKDERVSQKCTIIPMPVTYTMGSLISQFALNPEMGPIYNELLSQYGLTISVADTEYSDSTEYTRNYLKTHKADLPLSCVQIADKNYGFYIGEAGDAEIPGNYEYTPIPMKVKNCVKSEFNDVVFFGHNSQMKQVLLAIDRTIGRKKYKNRLLLIDSKKAIPDSFKLNNSEIKQVLTSEVDPAAIYMEVAEFLKTAKRDVTFVLLSNNEVSIEHADDETIATLVRVRELQALMVKNNPEIDVNKIKIVVEILDPKHHDVIKSFNVHNVIISNRLTSKMITQFAFESALFDLYLEMVVKNSDVEANAQTSLSSDMYTLKIEDCFNEIPQDITSYDLIRSVFEASAKAGGYVIVVGYIDKDGAITLFDRDQAQIKPNLTAGSQLILYHI